MCIEMVQVDPGSTLSIISKRLLYFLGIPLNTLSATTTTIYGFNVGSSHSLRKIWLRCRIQDLISEVTCYIIDADTSYNLLLRRPWIYVNWIIPSTLYRCFKFVEDNATVRTVFAEKQPIKGVENNITDAPLYQVANEVDKELLLEDDDSGNEADSELEEDTLATLDFKPIVAYFNNPQCNNSIEHDGEWVINENIIFDYPVSVVVFKSIDDSSIRMSSPMLSMTSTPIEDGKGSIFVIPTSQRSQSPIVFGNPECLQLHTRVRTQNPHNFSFMHDRRTT